ncbi:hypothetical protein HMPREF1548_04674 [Clostridium sp. KLE 1755]|nr:hypothetical protein HMPREF1548_04674 [Clostridium sp. KLE 1755]
MCTLRAVRGFFRWLRYPVLLRRWRVFSGAFQKWDVSNCSVLSGIG